MSNLPFLANKNQASAGPTTTLHRTPDQPADDSDAGLLAAAHEILEAIQQNDPQALSTALKAAFTLCDDDGDTDDESDDGDME
jgi:DNA-binding FadR family transcriptional regulator